MDRKIYIGGEPFINPLSLLIKRKLNFNNFLKSTYSNYYQTGGGYFSILNILQNIQFDKDEIVLLPSFLCPSILKPFKKINIKYKFYKINKNLQIDIADLKSRINENVKVIFYINYFGFLPKKEVLSELQKFQKKGIYLIEDCAQCLLPPKISISDFRFNSFRKFLPVDGSLLITDRKLKIQKNKKISKYVIIRDFARFLRFINAKLFINTSKIFLKLIAKSDTEKFYYHNNNSSLSFISKILLSKFSFESIKANRRKIFYEIVDVLKDKCIYNTLEDDTIPLGVPIIINARDNIRKQLIDKNIFCPIHWKLSEEIDKKKFAESWELSEQILTIPIRENFSELDMQYLINNIKKIV